MLIAIYLLFSFSIMISYDPDAPCRHPMRYFDSRSQGVQHLGRE